MRAWKRVNGETGRAQRAMRRGFTLVEIIVVIVIIGILATLIVPRVLSRVAQSKESTAKSNANAIAAEVTKAMIDLGVSTLPAGVTLEKLLMEKPTESEQAAKWRGPYLSNKEKLLDPWGRPFVLIIPGKKNVDFDIVSYGADGQAGGEGENADIVAP